MRLALIVEGHGEALALPILVERLLEHRDAVLRPPHRMKRHQMVRPEHLKRAVELQARRVGDDGAILVVLDADEDCAATLARDVLAIARDARPDREIGVVVADREYEAWLVAGAKSLRGKRGLPDDLQPPEIPDSLASPKRWLGERMPEGYSETRDQPALSALLDLEAAKGSRSFRKLVKELGRLVPRRDCASG